MKAKRGRPSLGADTKITISARVNAQDIAILQRRADKHEWSLSYYIAKLLTEAAQKEGRRP